MLGSSFIQAARAQVKERIVLYLANSCAVGALHIVSINLKLRLGINLRVVRKQQVAVGLLGVRLLRVFVNDDPSMENAVSLPVQNPVVKLAAVAVRTRVLDEHVVVHVLAAIGHEEAVDQALGA